MKNKQGFTLAEIMTVPTAMSDLVTMYITIPAGGTHTPGVLGADASCSVSGHTI